MNTLSKESIHNKICLCKNINNVTHKVLDNVVKNKPKTNSHNFLGVHLKNKYAVKATNILGKTAMSK